MNVESNLVFAHSLFEHDMSDAHLIKPTGNSDLDQSIRTMQQKIVDEGEIPQYLEALAWMFVSKSKETQSDGWLNGAHACSDRLMTKWSTYSGSLLLESYLLLQEHRFSEALELAGELLKRDPTAQAHMIYGDIAFDIGRLELAADAYQQAMNTKPSAEAYMRGANLNWVLGEWGQGAFNHPFSQVDDQ
ncbi:MAG: tetratricopeptide repeat protein [Verrucomicrobiota bacterium]